MSTGLSTKSKKTKSSTASSVPGQGVDSGGDSGSEPTSLFGDTTSADDTSDSPPGSTQSQMSASQVTVKQKKGKHAYSVIYK